jgi:chromate reductase
MSKPQVAVIVGSNRRESINRKFGKALAKLGDTKFDSHFVRIDDLPLYNQDHEANLPPEVARFKDEIKKADGVLMVRTVMLGLGMTLMGGESYVQFKPNLFDDDGNIGDETTQKFLQGFIDRFADLVEKLSGKKG